MSSLDKWCCVFDEALRTLFAVPVGYRSVPSQPLECPAAELGVTQGADDASGSVHTNGLNARDVKHAAGLMRVNHVGEVCAQALYLAQGLSTDNPKLKQQFAQAGHEELDHLAWTAKRLSELGASPSAFMPLWYAGAFVMGGAAGRMGDGVSLAFLAETENQVFEHLSRHLEKECDCAECLPLNDRSSRAIVEQMRIDEAKHRDEAMAAGAEPMPLFVCHAMRLAAKLMTSVAYRV